MLSALDLRVSNFLFGNPRISFPSVILGVVFNDCPGVLLIFCLAWLVESLLLRFWVELPKHKLYKLYKFRIKSLSQNLGTETGKPLKNCRGEREPLQVPKLLRSQTPRNGSKSKVGDARTACHESYNLDCFILIGSARYSMLISVRRILISPTYLFF